MPGNFPGVAIMPGNLGIPGHGCPGFYTKFRTSIEAGSSPTSQGMQGDDYRTLPRTFGGPRAVLATLAHFCSPPVTPVANQNQNRSSLPDAMLTTGQIIHQPTFEIRRFFENKPEILQLKSLTNRILLVQICFIALNVFELFSSKKFFFIFSFFLRTRKSRNVQKWYL